jgi:hypothetical protein
MKCMNPHGARRQNINEEIKTAYMELYQCISQHDNPITAALGYYDIHMHYSEHETKAEPR